MLQVCPIHTSEDVPAVARPEAPGSQSFTCPRPDHPVPGPFTWFFVPPPPGSRGFSELAAEYHLDAELPSALQRYAGQWVEYGVLEHAYATNCPEDFAALVARYGHRAAKPKKYTVSAFLAGTLGHLGRQGVVAYHDGPATGRWDYLPSVSWWSLPPAPEWDASVSWESRNKSMGYVPGNNEPWPAPTRGTELRQR